MSTQVQAEHPPVHVRDFLAGSAFSAAGMVVGGVLTTLTGIVFARWLNPEGFGLYSLALVAVTFIGGLGTAGMDNMVARFAAYYLGTGDIQKIRATLRYGLRSALVLALVLAVVTRLGLNVTGTALSALDLVGWYVAATVPLLALQLVLQQALSGLQRVRTRVVLEKIVQPTLRLGLPFLLLVWIHSPLQAAVAGLTVTALLVSAAALLSLLKSTRTLPADKSQSDDKRQWFKYALPFVFYALQSFVCTGMGVDVFLISILASVRDSGVYAAAFRFAPILLLVRGAMDYAFGPKVGVLYGESDFRTIGTLYKMSSTVGLTWTLPLAVVLALFGQGLMGRVFGPAYAEGGTALAVLVLGFAVDAATGCNATLLAVIGRPWLVLLNGLVSGGATIVLCLALIPQHGILGAAFAVTVARTAANVLTTTQIWYLHRLHPFDSSTLKVSFAGVAAAAVGIICREQLYVSGPSILLVAIALVLGAYLGILRLVRLHWSPR